MSKLGCASPNQHSTAHNTACYIISLHASHMSTSSESPPTITHSCYGNRLLVAMVIKSAILVCLGTYLTWFSVILILILYMSWILKALFYCLLINLFHQTSMNYSQDIFSGYQIYCKITIYAVMK